MPELPDLQVFSSNLNKKFSGKTLKKISIENKKKLKNSVEEFKALEGKELKKIYREGKELYFQFSDKNILAMHLMLRGQFYFFEKKNAHKYTIAELLFDDDTGLALTDFQGMANVHLNPEESKAPDALSDEMNTAFLKETLTAKKTIIKTVLLDQHIIRGIGNAYADEILWEAGISPFSASNKIPADKIKGLATAIKTVLKDGEHQIKKEKPDIISGEIRDFLKIHNAHKTHSPTGAKIQQKTIGGRKTYFTDEQELYK
jgi:formamidopyrimidine-DNA glycosylase